MVKGFLSSTLSHLGFAKKAIGLLKQGVTIFAVKAAGVAIRDRVLISWTSTEPITILLLNCHILLLQNWKSS